MTTNCSSSMYNTWSKMILSNCDIANDDNLSSSYSRFNKYALASSILCSFTKLIIHRYWKLIKSYKTFMFHSCFIEYVFVSDNSKYYSQVLVLSTSVNSRLTHGTKFVSLMYIKLGFRFIFI